jgi:hypothetical protein
MNYAICEKLKDGKQVDLMYVNTKKAAQEILKDTPIKFRNVHGRMVFKKNVFIEPARGMCSK